jgi:hypothetical protein
MKCIKRSIKKVVRLDFSVYQSRHKFDRYQDTKPLHYFTTSPLQHFSRWCNTIPLLPCWSIPPFQHAARLQRSQMNTPNLTVSCHALLGELFDETDIH